MLQASEAGQIIVYLCAGGVTRLPAAATVAFEDDRMVFLDRQGRVVAKLRAADVYACAREPLPAVPSG